MVRVMLGGGGSLLGGLDLARWLLRLGLSPSLVYSLQGIRAPHPVLPTYQPPLAEAATSVAGYEEPQRRDSQAERPSLLRWKRDGQGQGQPGAGLAASAALRGTLGGAGSPLGVLVASVFVCFLLSASTPGEAEGSVTGAMS